MEGIPSGSASPFLKHLHTNYAPSRSELSQIRALVQERQKLVDALDREIDVLLKRREEQSNFVKDHSALLSPIRRLPNEILSLIFLTSLPRNTPTRRRTILSKYHPAVVVSHVCQHWRRVSLNTPQLWTVIDIDVPKFPAPHESVLEGGIDWWEGRIQAIYEMTTAWISRSGGHSLTVSFTGGLNILFSHLLEEDIVSRANESVARIADALCNVSDRWKAAHLSLDVLRETSPPGQLLHLTFDDVTRLESLSLDVRVGRPGIRSSLELVSGRELVKAPYLRRLAIGRSWVVSMSLPVDWAGLTELSFIAPWGPPDYTFPFPILVACPNLTRCVLQLPSAPPVPETPTTEISLLHLHTLELWGAEPHPIYTSRLHLPSLRHLTLLCQPHYQKDEFDSGTIGLIKKFGEALTDVMLDSRGFTGSLLHRVLLFLPNIVSLRLVEGVRHGIQTFQGPVTFDSALDELSRGDGGPDNGPLCPKLERFGWQMTTRSVFSQAALVRLVASRRPGSHTLQPPRPKNEPCVLRSVVVAFSTRRFNRITRDVLEEMGVDLDDMTLITTYQGEDIDTPVSGNHIQMNDLYDDPDFASTVGQRRRTLDGWFL